MPRLLALEWDSRELRLASGEARAGDLTIESLVSVPLSAPEQSAIDPAFRDKLVAAVSEHRLARGDVTVLLGRASVELKQLMLPPAPDAELPAMVRYQSLREFTNLAEDWPLDYFPLADNPEAQRPVLAAAVSPQVSEQIRADCQAAGLHLGRLLLRPCAMAGLFLRHPQANQHAVRLLVDLMAVEADLTVLADQRVVFTRTTRLPADMAAAPEECRPLIGEIRRTLAAIHNQLSDQRVEAIYLSGATPQHQELARRLGEDLGLPVVAIDLLSGVAMGRGIKAAPPANVARFAALVGALVDEARATPPTFDFLNPRRPPEPPSRRRTWLMASAAALLLLALVGGGIGQSLRSRTAQNDQLAAKVNSVSLNAAVTEAELLERDVEEIDAWLASDICWLDEFVYLSQRAPGAQDTMLLELRAGAHPEGGELYLEGLVSNSSVVDKFEADIRDARHRVEGKNRVLEGKHPLYKWKFSSSILIRREAEDADDGQNAPAVSNPKN